MIIAFQLFMFNYFIAKEKLFLIIRCLLKSYYAPNYIILPANNLSIQGGQYVARGQRT